jgi:hypothetical protein
VLGVLLIPVCYVAVRRLMGEKLDEPAAAPTGTPPAAPTGASPVAGPAQRRED